MTGSHASNPPAESPRLEPAAEHRLWSIDDVARYHCEEKRKQEVHTPIEFSSPIARKIPWYYGATTTRGRASSSALRS